MKAAVSRVLWRLRNRRSYEPAEYWERRASELIETYDHPETWAERGWTTSGIEESLVPKLLTRERIRSAFVVGAGSGRQYGFLSTLDIDLRGIDISPTLVDECRTRYPNITTTLDSIVGAEVRHSPSECVLSTAVLQHVPPAQIVEATCAVQTLAKRLVIIREMTYLALPSSYIWAHDYEALFSDWNLIEHEITDETDTIRVTLMGWRRRRAGSER